MKKQKTGSTSLEYLFGNSFYDKTHVAKLPEQIVIFEQPSRSLPRFELSNDTLRIIYKTAEMLNTKEGPKLLAFHNPYLIWFHQDAKKQSWIPTNQGENAEMENDSQLNSVPQVEGWTDIRGYFVDTHDHKESQTRWSSVNAGFYQDLKLSQGGSKSPTRSYLLDISDEWKGEYSAVYMPEMSLGQNLQPQPQQYHLSLRKHMEDRPGEIIYFQTEEQHEDWRKKFSYAPVFFTDFENRYSQLGQDRKEGSQRILKAQHNKSQETVIARVYDPHHSQDSPRVEEVKVQLLREASILSKLVATGVCRNFRELCYSKTNSFMIVEEYVDQIPFTDWFSTTWCPEHADQTDTAAALSLMADLTNLVVSLNNAGVCHGNLCKDNFFVRTSPASFDSSVAVRMTSTPKIRYQPPEFSGRKTPGFSQMVGCSGFLKTLLGSRKGSFHLIGKESGINSSKMFRGASISFKIMLKGFGRERQQNGKHFTYNNADSSKPHEPQPTPAAKTGMSKADVYALGLLFVEILFGLDCRKACSQGTDSEAQIAKSIQEGSAEVLLGLEPLYNLDSRLVHMLVQMLHSDQVVRPEPQNCLQTISQVLHDCTNPAFKRQASGMKRSTVMSRQTIEGLWSGINSINHRKDSFKFAVPASSTIGAFEIQSAGKVPSEPDRQRSEVKHLLVQPQQESRIKGSSIFERSFQAIKRRSSLGLKTILSLESMISLKTELRAPPGVLLRRLGLSMSQKAISVRPLREHKTHEPSSHSLSPTRSLSLPGVCLTGREYFKPQNKLQKVKLEDGSVDKHYQRSCLHPRKSATQRPDASTRSISLCAQLTFERLKQKSNLSSSNTGSVMLKKKNSLPQSEVMLCKLLTANMIEMASLFSVVDKHTARKPQDIINKFSKPTKIGSFTSTYARIGTD